MNYTEKQKEAIYIENTNVIVSAGAGSGKTAVLTERVINKLLNGVHINELLLLTFTDNAAKEMKTRIKDKILNYSELINEAKLVDSADITTFDAFTLSLVKKYHYYLNLSNDIKIIDSSIINKKKKDYLNDIFNAYYDEKNPIFEEFILNFGNKNDQNIKNALLKIEKKIDLITNKEEYLKNYVNNYYDINNINALFKEYENLLLDKTSTIKALLLNLSYEVDNNYYQKIDTSLKPLLNAQSYDEIRFALNNINMPRLMNASDKAKFYKEKITKIKDELKKECVYAKDVLIENAIENKKYATIIIDIISKLNNKINEYKTYHNAYEFNDISKLAIKLIKEYDDVKNYLKYHYQEIMIDEYQDTSDIQEEFISLIENNNVYMVGDIKQSIYRFRNANPNIFKIKYDKYKNNINGYKIDLNENFRSRKEVLSSINDIFSHIMDIKIGNADYAKEHMLIHGNQSFSNEGNNNYDNNLEILNYQKDDNTYTSDEIEAFIIANDIKKKINDKYLVFDKKLRPCTYQDFCILMDRTTTFDTYKKVFDFLNIPLNIYKDNDILLTNEVLLINNIIALILNIKNNIADNNNLYFASIARSYLFRLTDQEIYDIITNKSIKTTTIYNICKEISNKIDILSNKNIIYLIINKFNFYDKMITIGNTLERTAILNNLIIKFSELDKVACTIYELNDYLNTLINDNESIKIPAIISDNDSVTITNIHKSKGLEYKICYYSGLNKGFNMMDLNSRINFNNNYGLILPSYNDGFITTFISSLNKNTYYLEEISEKIRLFYVALTRAKEKMIIVTSLKDDVIDIYDSQEIVDYITRSKYSSFADILNSCHKYIQKYIKNISIPTINLNYKFTKNNALNNIKNADPIVVNEIDNNYTLINENYYSKTNNTLYNMEEINNLNLGTKMHYILENLVFINPDLSIYNDLELEIINGLLNSSILSNINKANVYKEYEFIDDRDNCIKHGIIDLMLEYESFIDIIDYKLKNTTDKAYINQLNGYKDYIEFKTKKKVNIYLYSLLDKQIIDLN